MFKFGKKRSITSKAAGSGSSGVAVSSTSMMMHHHHHQITEDTPPDMLAGAMDLTVHLPTGRTVKMSVERSTPMMDLLVQITTAHHLQLSSHVIQALGMAPSSEYSDKVLPYKPSTPIGALDTQHIKVIPKGRTLPVAKNIPAGHQPFESTFRLKVHLPRNQLYVIRVSQNVFIENIMKKVCEEKNLDPMKYECRHPGSLDEVLDPKLTLSDYRITEIYIVIKGTIGLTQAYPTTDIMALRKEEERKQLHNKTGSSVFNLIFKKGKTNMGSGSLSSENRSISPTQSDESRSVTPPAIPQKIVTPVQTSMPPPEKPKVPQRKRRPAPKPPQPADTQSNVPSSPPVESSASNVSSISDTNCESSDAKKVDNGLTICHSRNSSDSSGYHEASILSDHCNTSLPRRPKTAVIPDHVGRTIGEHSRSSGNLTKMMLHSKSMSSLPHPGRKKKAAPPPPPVLKNSTSVSNLDSASPVVSASQTTSHYSELVSQPITEVSRKSSLETCQPVKIEELHDPEENKRANTIQETVKSEKLIETVKTEKFNEPVKAEKFKEPKREEKVEVTKINPQIVEKPLETKSVEVNEAEIIPQQAEIKLSPKEETVLTSDLDEEHKSEVDSGVGLNLSKSPSDSKDEGINELEVDWQYQLPSPPTAFRDASPTNLTNYETITLEGFNPTDSIVTNPELFEKLKHVKDTQFEKDATSDLTSITSEDENKEILNKLSLENLEKRKSLVYNRELSTSLKFAQEENVNISPSKQDSIIKKRSNVLNELEGVIATGKTSSLSRHNSRATEGAIQSPTDSTLPNFKITTYDKPKEKINIFEDDTIRSNSENKRNSFVDPKRNSVAELPRSSFETNFEIASNLKRNSFSGRSMENISFRRTSFENSVEEATFKKPPEYGKYKSKTNFYTRTQDVNVTRSGSFSMNYANTGWTPTNPVKRSKSQIALNKYKEDQRETTTSGDSLHKSNSLYDVSGLQSLEVIRKIQTSLKTPNGSMEHLAQKPAVEKKYYVPEEPKTQIPEKPVQSSTTNFKTSYQLRSPPVVNLSAWSERPKSQVNLKEDSDYKFNKKEKDNINSKLIVNTTNNNISSTNTIEVKNGSSQIKPSESFTKTNYVNSNYNGVSIKVNGSESISSQHPGKVFIKIGNTDTKLRDNEAPQQKYLSHSTTVGFRKPLGNINKIETKQPRPHSIAFDSEYQPPVVRSVEYKKPFMEMQNKSITQIYSSELYDNNLNYNVYNGNETKSLGSIAAEERRNSSELKSLNKNSQVYLSSDSVARPTVKFNNIASKVVPVVKGFRNFETSHNTINNRMSWNPQSNYNTLPSKSNINNYKEETYSGTNNNVPFSQSNLKRTDSNKVSFNNNNTNANSFPNVVLRSTQNTMNRPSSINKLNGHSGNPNVPSPPKPPPLIKANIPNTKIEPQVDPRSELLSAIRNFGGKKGLKSVK